MPKLKVYTGNANPKLAQSIVDHLGINLGKIDVGTFPDGECQVKIHDDVRGSDVFIIQPTCTPVNQNLMELLVMVDAFKRASAHRITAVIPYFGYGRQDRKDEGRVPITAKLVANLLEKAGVSRVITLDLHAAQIQGFFDIPVDHLCARKKLVNLIRSFNLPNLAIGSPDAGGMKNAYQYSKSLNANLVVIEKRRVSADEVEAGFVMGDVKDKNVILVDDMIATGGSIIQAVNLLYQNGANQVWIMATHAVFCGQALQRIEDSTVERVIVTDSIPQSKGVLDGTLPYSKVEVVSIADLLGETIDKVHNHKSVSALFEE